MNLEVDVERLFLARKTVRAELLAERGAGGAWEGRVGSSPVATAAAVSALVVAHRRDSDDTLRQMATGDHVIDQLVQCDLSELVLESVHWLARRQNEDGGWGDCDGAESNLAATLLVQAAFRLTGIPAKYADLMARADDYVEAAGGIASLRRRVGRDKACFVPVLANCALADMFGWRNVPTLPFEWFSLPKKWRRDLPAPVSRAAAPIVFAVGLAKFHHDPPRNPLMRITRGWARKKSLAYLAQMQATDDSYFASPLVTAFVVMNLASMGYQDHPIVERGVEYLLSSVRADASWSVASSLSTTNTALALECLAIPAKPADNAAARHAAVDDSQTDHRRETMSVHDTVIDHPPVVASEIETDALPDDLRSLTKDGIDWLLKSQHVLPSTITDAPAGAWGESDAGGAEPNVLATAAALRTLARSYQNYGDATYRRIEHAAVLGVEWLLAMQNEDGGWPTYCRHEELQLLAASGVDPTALGIRALAAWQRIWKAASHDGVSSPKAALAVRISPAVERAFKYLESQQTDDGSFVPLWFGNEHQPEEANPAIGTALALGAYSECQLLEVPAVDRARAWLVAAQHADGGWGPPRARLDYSGDEDGGFRAWQTNEAVAKFCSVEETAAVVLALLPLIGTSPAVERSVSRGLSWLANAVERDAHRQAANIGFYFLRIWYHDRLYPLALAAGALSQGLGALASAKSPAAVSVR